MKTKKNRISNDKPQTVMVTRVIIMEGDSFNIIGSGYLITKANSLQRLDIMDFNGNHIEPGYYNVQQTSYHRLGFTSDRIQ